MAEPLLRWRAEFALGIPGLDREHRAMIDLINRCYAELGSDPDAAAIERTLGEIHAAIAGHFALEERIMRTAGYARLAEHKGDHEALLDELRELMDGFTADPVAGRLVLERALGEWFARHFRSFDAALHGALGPMLG
jgi:hemerythrin-like metal-binding protein